ELRGAPAGPALDPASDQPPARRIAADLPGAEDELPGDDRLRVRTDRAGRALGRDRLPLAAHVRTRATFITPRTRPRFRMTRFSSSALFTMSSKVFCALWSPIACTRARAMLIPAELIAFDIAARSPG